MDDFEDDAPTSPAPREREASPAASPLTALAALPGDMFGGLSPDVLMAQARAFTDVDAPNRARAAGYLAPKKTGHFSESFGNALSGYNDAKVKQDEIAARYFPIVARVAQQRQQMKLQQEAQARATLDAAGAASLMDPGLSLEKLQAQVVGLAQQGRVPGEMAQKFLEGLPKDPTQLRAALTTAALARTDPYRAVAKPEFKNVAEGASLFKIDPITQVGTEVASGRAKPTSISKLLEEMNALPPNDPRRATYLDAIKKATTHPPATSVMVNAEKPLIGSFMDLIGKQAGEAYTAAQAATTTIGTTQRLLDLLSSSNIMTGPGAPAGQVLGRLAELGGFGGRDNRERLSNTRVAIQTMSQLELDAASAMKGQGAITDSERAILKRAASGEITDDIQEIRSLAITLQNVARRRIKRYNEQAARLAKLPGLAGVAPILMVDEGDATAQPTLRFDANGRPIENPKPGGR
jgi:hypothetical protein